MAYAFNDDKGKYDLDENVLGGASNTLYDAEVAIVENAADIAALQDLVSNGSYVTPSTYTVGTGVEIKAFVLYKLGRLVFMRLQFHCTQERHNGDVIISGIPSQLRPVIDCLITGKGSSSVPVGIGFTPEGKIVFGPGGSGAGNEWIQAGAVYIV